MLAFRRLARIQGVIVGSEITELRLVEVEIDFAYCRFRSHPIRGRDSFVG